MRGLHLFLISLLVASAAQAARTEFWRIRTPDEFLSGEFEGVAITSRGQLTAGPALERLAPFSDPFVLSQVSDRGVRFVGTGNEGNVYRIEGDQKTLLYKATEPEIYAMAFHRGSLWVASSPHGKIYRVDPRSGSASVFFDPEEAYIWAIAPLSDGSMLVGTGTEGRLWKVSADGNGEVLFDAPESHIRSLATSGARILAGGAGEGRIYEIQASGKGRALFDSDLSEISSIWIDPKDGIAWAAAVSSTLPASAPPKPDPAKPEQPGTAQQPAQQQSSAAAPAPAIDVSFSFDQPTTGAGGGSSEIYRIDRDGFVTTVRKLEKEMVYAIEGDPRGGVLFGTGPLGRLYSLRDGDLTLLASVPEKQVVSIATEPRGLAVTTTNSGALYRLRDAGTEKAEFRSSIKDTLRFSRFGEYAIEGRALEGVVSAFRSGNTSTPDDTWSEWVSSTGPRGAVGAPPARYLQWRITVERPAPQFAIDSMSAAWTNRNAAPRIESVSVNEPGVVFVSGAYPSSPQVLEATNPDEYGIFSSLENPRPSDPGKRLFRKGYRTVSWKASDPNGDALRYTVEFRPAGSGEWLPMRERIEETQVNFDSSQLPDGPYEIRVTATDERDNPENPLTDSRIGGEFSVDNTAPSIEVRSAGDEIVATVRDAQSPILRAEYALDAEEWIRIAPEDGMADGLEEVFRFRKADVRDRFVILRVVDSSWNVATAKIEP